MEKPYSEREVRAIADSVNSLNTEFRAYTEKVNEYISQDAVAHANMIAAMTSLRKDTDDNTEFRKRMINAVVGTAFVALSALGLAVLKITGVLNLTR